jgi:hypothetical protein
MTCRPPDVDTVLQQAADYLELHGWCRGSLGRRGGPNCVVGALFEIAQTPMVRAAAERLASEIGTSNVAWWNDQRGRSQAEVIAALRGTGART